MKTKLFKRLSNAGLNEDQCHEVVTILLDIHNSIERELVKRYKKKYDFKLSKIFEDELNK